MIARIAFILLGLSFTGGYVHAQYPSVLGRFEVDQVKGCAPLTVTLTLNPAYPCDTGNPCAVFYENSTTSEPLTNPPFNHTYTQPGIYYLKTLRHPIWDSIRIEVTANIPPQFDLYTCSGNEVSVQLNDDNYDEYIINYNDGSPESLVNGTGSDNHVYASGTHTVAVRGHNVGAADNCNTAGRIVTPLNTLPAPTITRVEVLDDSQIRLEFDALPNVQYRLGIATNNSANFQQAGTLYNQTETTITGLRTNDNYYCFQLAAFDPCNNSVFNSSVICSQRLNLNVVNKAIDVSWTTSPTGIVSRSLQRTAGDGSTFVTTPSASPYHDTGIICGMEYCYQLTAVYANGSRSVSMSKCGTGFSTETPPAIDNITAIVGENSVVLQWESDPDFIPSEFTIEKSAGGSYSQYATTTQHAFADEQYLTEEATCYRIRYTDVCDNASPVSVEACPIRLTASLRNDNSIILQWTPYEGWANGVDTYVIEKYAEDGTLLQTFAAGTTTTYIDESDDLDHQALVYVVRATPVANGLAQAVSNRAIALKDPNIFHPTAFTPNGDNLNDIFTVFGHYVTKFEMSIFNRWGEMLFTTHDITSGWDGTYKGREMPEGTYTFIANITDSVGRTFKRSGSVLLLRRD